MAQVRLSTGIMIGKSAILGKRARENLCLLLFVVSSLALMIMSLAGCTGISQPAGPAWRDMDSDRQENSSQGQLCGNSQAVDSDSDGLSDFQELHKYLTDPANKDTDGDGVPDGDWNERREYTYSVCSIIRFMPPFDKAAINDDFQDARVLEERDNYTELEVVHYPFGTAGRSVDENPTWERDYAHMTEYLRPGITTNWDAKMRRDLLAELKADGILVDELTDKQVVERVSSWLTAKSRSLDKVFTTYYVHFPDGRPSVYPGLEGAFEREFDRDKENYDWTIDRHFDRELLGKGMFYNKTHGSCTSFAVYLTTVLRALGIPTRMIIVVPAVDPSNRQQLTLVSERITHNKVRETSLAGLRRSREGFTAHTFNEVYIGNRWHRLNYNKLGQTVLDRHLFGLHTHLYTFNDLSRANLAPTWGRRYAKGEKDTVFRYSNPYSAIVLSDLFGRHSNIPNPPFTAQDLSPSRPSAGSDLPNIYVMSPSNFNMFREIFDIVGDVTLNKTGRPHDMKSYDSIFVEGIWGKKPGDIIVLLFSLDRDDRIPAEYEDLLPMPWPGIESSLKQRKTLELNSDAREMNVILLAAATADQLRELVRESNLLEALSGKGNESGEKSRGERWSRTGRTKEPVAYTVTIPEDNWRKAVVSCRMETAEALSLWMNNNGAPRVPNGHASFVRNLTAVDSAGNTVPIKDFQRARWKIAPTDNQPVTLSYQVLLEHDKSDLPWGPDEAPYVTEDGAFWTGRALFIVADMKDITVCFNLPDRWRVSTPWQPIPNRASTFCLKDAEELTEAFIFAGTHIEQQVRVGDMEILLALGTQMKRSKEVLRTASQKLLNCCVELFGGTVPGRTLIVLNHQDREHTFDGGVFGRSVSMLMGDEPNRENMERWTPFVAHEVLHLWNGQAIGHAGHENWFSEGFTDYYAMVVCSRSGLISEKEFIQRFRRASEMYFSKSGQSSIREAHDYELQYAGGSLVAASLDVLIRNSTENTKSLDNLMQHMHKEFGKTGRKYLIEDVTRIANDITRTDHAEFFRRYVQGTGQLPLEEYFGYMGLDLRKEITEELPDRDFAIHEMLHIMSLSQSGETLLIRRSQEADYQDEDYLTAIDGTPVRSFRDIQAVAKKLKPGDKIKVALLRGGKEITMEITLGGKGQRVPLERKVEVEIDKKTELTSSQEAILSGITGR